MRTQSKCSLKPLGGAASLWPEQIPWAIHIVGMQGLSTLWACRGYLHSGHAGAIHIVGMQGAARAKGASLAKPDKYPQEISLSTLSPLLPSVNKFLKT